MHPQDLIAVRMYEPINKIYDGRDDDLTYYALAPALIAVVCQSNQLIFLSLIAKLALYFSAPGSHLLNPL